MPPEKTTNHSPWTSYPTCYWNSSGFPWFGSAVCAKVIHPLNSITYRISCSAHTFCSSIVSLMIESQFTFQQTYTSLILLETATSHFTTVPKIANCVTPPNPNRLILLPTRLPHFTTVLKIANCVTPANPKPLILLPTDLRHFMIALKITNCVTPPHASDFVPDLPAPYNKGVQ